MTPTVSQIAIAPVKSLRIIPVDRAEVGPSGVIGDRVYAMLNQSRRRLSATKHPELLRARSGLQWDSPTPVNINHTRQGCITGDT